MGGGGGFLGPWDPTWRLEFDCHIAETPLNLPQMTQEWPKYGIRSGMNVVTTEIIVYPFEF